MFGSSDDMTVAEEETRLVRQSRRQLDDRSRAGGIVMTRNEATRTPPRLHVLSQLITIGGQIGHVRHGDL
jgi:hypothetical protein